MNTAIAEPAVYTGWDSMPIAGDWVRGSGSGTLVDVNPWSGETLTEIPYATAADLDHAFASAATAQAAWAARPPAERAAVMLRAADILTDRAGEIVDWLVRESGGTVAKSTIELGVVQAAFRQAATLPHRVQGRLLLSDIPGKEHRVHRRPVGVVAIISPWNFALYLTARSLAPALAVGNGVVLKPAQDTPVSGGLLLARVLDEAGLPPGLLNVVIGRGRDIGDAMVEHDVPRVISFTGSTAVGLGITRKAGVKHLSLELGGNGPLVVLDDADLDRAVPAAVWGSFYNQGQICMIANRIIVDRSVHDAFVERFVATVRALNLGDPLDPVTDIGPVVNARQLGAIRDKIDRATTAGAEQLTGGEPTGPTGLVLPPHVLLGTSDVATAREEVFGPVITIIRADDEADALAIANDTEYGLTSSVFTRDIDRGVRFGLRIQAGMTHVNDCSVHDEPHLPFGGEKQSGIGRFGGHWVADEFTTEHLVSVQHSPREYKL